jgi:hypothetical protein
MPMQRGTEAPSWQPGSVTRPVSEWDFGQFQPPHPAFESPEQSPDCVELRLSSLLFLVQIWPGYRFHRNLCCFFFLLVLELELRAFLFARQACCHLSCAPQPLFAFSDMVSHFFPRLASNYDFTFASSVARITGTYHHAQLNVIFRSQVWGNFLYNHSDCNSGHYPLVS